MRIARPAGWLRRLAIVVALTATGGVGLALPGQAATAPRWDNAGARITARSQFAVVALPDHSVLAVGGSSTTAVSAEVWRPSTRTWTAVAPLRVGHGGGTSAVLLADGRVLVAGGCSGGHCPSVTADAEIFNPATHAWTTTGPTITPHGYATLTRLASGQVLLAGGCTGRLCARPNSTAELFDPNTGRWSPTGSMISGAEGESPVSAGSVRLDSGQILVAGGFNFFSSGQLYDPVTGVWRATASMTTPRESLTLTKLPTGAVLAAGGCDAYYCQTILSSAEIYNPVSGLWDRTSDMHSPRAGHTAVAMPTGQVLITGGNTTAGGPTATAERYDAPTASWLPTIPMHSPRAFHAAALLCDGRILEAGGGPASAEVYTP